MISDYWKGFAVHRSEDFSHWIRCRDILDGSGNRPMDRGWGHHTDVVVRDGRAFIFYFCHPYACEGEAEGKEPSGLTEQEWSKAVVQAAELVVRDGELWCDRDAQVTWPG